MDEYEKLTFLGDTAPALMRVLHARAKRHDGSSRVQVAYRDMASEAEITIKIAVRLCHRFRSVGLIKLLARGRNGRINTYGLMPLTDEKITEARQKWSAMSAAQHWGLRSSVLKRVFGV